MTRLKAILLLLVLLLAGCGQKSTRYVMLPSGDVVKTEVSDRVVYYETVQAMFGPDSCKGMPSEAVCGMSLMGRAMALRDIEAGVDNNQALLGLTEDIKSIGLVGIPMLPGYKAVSSPRNVHVGEGGAYSTNESHITASDGASSSTPQLSPPTTIDITDTVQ